MKHILIAEDQKSARIVLTFHLKKAGYKVTSAENGAIALNILQDYQNTNEKIDLLVTDIEMPEMSGLDLYKNLADLKFDIPVIVMTAYGSKNIVVELMRLGCSEYLDKPFPPEELLTRVEQIIDEEEKKKEDLKKIEKDKFFLENELDNYKYSSQKLREQVNSAKDAYNSLIHIEEDNLKVNLDYKIKPLADLGGDFFAIRNNSKGCDILLADVAGHDIGSSFHTILIKSAFEENVKLEKNGSAFFSDLNTRLINDYNNNRLVSGIFIRINLELMKAYVTSAGHQAPIIIKKNSNEPQQINVSGDILGIFDDVSFQNISVDISPMDRILFFTDGIEDSGYIDKKSGEKIKLKASGIIKLATEFKDFELQLFVKNIWDEVQNFNRNNAKDDMSLVTIEIK